MQVENIKKGSSQGMYSIEQYEGAKKWCFAIVLNRAQTNLQGNPKLFEETLTRFERIRKEDWFDQETKKLIYAKQEQNEVEEEIQKAADEKLRDLRNYFSHYFHTPDCLIFTQNDPVRIIMEKAYEKARFEQAKKEQEDISIEFGELFEENGRITSAGVVFFASFFAERRFLNRLMGYVQGFTRTEGEYKITRDVFSTYCLRDSYSVKTPDHDAVMFRDILGYLSRVPSESYQRIKESQMRSETQLSERKTDKFILFALNYLEDYGLEDLADYTACFARTRIKREQDENTDGKEQKPHRKKPRVEIHFERAEGDPFYIKHNNVILRTQKKGAQTYIFRMGVYELKYLVLLSLLGKGAEAVKRIDRYVHSLRNQLPHIEKKSTEEIEGYVRFLPRFVRSHLGLLGVDDEKKIKARVDYVKAKWLEKKEKSRELQLHRKGRDILRYINERCERPLNIDEYNRILELLVTKHLDGFYRELEELKKTRRIDKNIVCNLSRHKSVNALHEKVCDLVVQELESLGREELKEYVGLIPKEEKEVSFEEKTDRVVKQPVIYKGFLRNEFFRESRKSFARLVEEAVREKGEVYDVPLGGEYYEIVSLDTFDKDNKRLYETLAMDRLLLMIARQYHLSLNKELAKRAQQIEWKKEDGEEVIIFTLKNPAQPEQSCSVRFSLRDYTKLYVMDDAEFLARLCDYFLPKDEEQIDYHRLYTQGMNRYTNLQREGIEAILELEKKTIGPEQPRPPKNYIPFSEIMDKSAYNEDDQKALRRVRNALLHHNLNFARADFKRFCGIMKREGIEKRWSLAV